jgi:glycerophosphoryl diester phosphodiesterase
LCRIASAAVADGGAPPAIAGEPMLIAHRGLLRYAPENTMPAFAACVELSLGFELDVYSSRDDQLVVIHSANLNSTTNGPNRSVREFSVPELKRFDAGAWFHPSFRGLAIPTLEEVLSMVRQRRRGPTMIAINVKQITSAGERQLVTLVTKYGLLKESFAFEQADACSRRLKLHNPAFRISQNVSRQNLSQRLVPGELDVFMLSFLPTPDEMSLLRRQKKTVLFNAAGATLAHRSPATWDRVKEAGFDGLLTDFVLDCRLHWRNQQ